MSLLSQVSNAWDLCSNCHKFAKQNPKKCGSSHKSQENFHFSLEYLYRSITVSQQVLTALEFAFPQQEEEEIYNFFRWRAHIAPFSLPCCRLHWPAVAATVWVVVWYTRVWHRLENTWLRTWRTWTEKHPPRAADRTIYWEAVACKVNWANLHEPTSRPI